MVEKEFRPHLLPRGVRTVVSRRFSKPTFCKIGRGQPTIYLPPEYQPEDYYHEVGHATLHDPRRASSFREFIRQELEAENWAGRYTKVGITPKYVVKLWWDCHDQFHSNPDNVETYTLIILENLLGEARAKSIVEAARKITPFEAFQD